MALKNKIKKKMSIKKTSTKKSIIAKKTKKTKPKLIKKTVKVKKKKNTKKKNLIDRIDTKKLVKKKSKIKKIIKKKSLIKNKKYKKVLSKNKKKLVKKNEKKIINFDDFIKKIVTKLIEKNKVDGIYTSKIVQKGIPKKFRISENISKVENFLKKNNIKIISEEEAIELTKANQEVKNSNEETSEEKKQTGKTDDPVRLYLRDMGSVELLSREGEIAIAKRIEAGRERMIGAICESPMTIRSIINWKESIKEGTMLLRDIVDLEQTYDMSDISVVKADDTLKLIEGMNEVEKSKEDKQSNKNIDNNEDGESENSSEEEGLNVSLAAMEEKT